MKIAYFSWITILAAALSHASLLPNDPHVSVNDLSDQLRVDEDCARALVIALAEDSATANNPSSVLAKLITGNTRFEDLTPEDQAILQEEISTMDKTKSKVSRDII